ncbi:hypothetical protein [Thermococcus radiotolerans]|nr:hypothetical protein [Thermococcus radiotolerans]
MSGQEVPHEDITTYHSQQDIILKEILEEIKKILENYEVGTREYELAITKLVSKSLIEKLKNKKYLEDKIQLRIRDEDNKNIGFTLFFVLFTFHRRIGNYDKLIDLIKRYDQEFKDVPFLWHLKAMAYKNLNEFKKSLEAAYRAVKDPILRENPGVLHNFAESVVELFEWNEIDFEDAEKIDIYTESFTPKELLNMAEKYLNEAIDKGDYPKFYITLGRLYIIKGEFKRAIELITRGISLEDPTEKDYTLRLSQYMMYLYYAKLLKALKNEIKREELEIMQLFEQEKSKIMEFLSTERLRNIEILAIFTAIIGVLVTTGTTLPASSNNINIINLILVLGGILLLFVLLPFGLNLIIFDRKKLDLFSVIVIALSILLSVFIIIGGMGRWFT